MSIDWNLALSVAIGIGLFALAVAVVAGIRQFLGDAIASGQFKVHWPSMGLVLLILAGPMLLLSGIAKFAPVSDDTSETLMLIAVGTFFATIYLPIAGLILIPLVQGVYSLLRGRAARSVRATAE